MFTLEISTSNDAFAAGAGTEVARILRDVASAVADHTDGTDGLIRDYNGAKVGSWRLAPR